MQNTSQDITEGFPKKTMKCEKCGENIEGDRHMMNHLEFHKREEMEAVREQADKVNDQ